MKTDAQLQQDVIAELGREPAVKATQIGVEVKDGIVTLAGHVDSYTEKWHAESAAQRVAGVMGLAVEIDVTLPGLSKRTDADIARPASIVLEWTTSLPKDAVGPGIEPALKRRAQDDAQRVMVDIPGGDVTLSGTVQSWSERELATRSAWSAPGVRTVVDNITIAP